MEQFIAVSLQSMLDSKILPSRVQLLTTDLQDCWRKEAIILLISGDNIYRAKHVYLQNVT